ncbi:hypothetical protein BDY21DRAFT_116490 [Lineolata rhizophorae]|uniref:Uncharacterized protein n=1 Tax=Lineolata rhizophorae TaxID=578093 RepID=A0A6A6NRD4_9PEZI|nr:hypothetical protein BDY21DRAFT_116490 [Lineolata rhizophorae]
MASYKLTITVPDPVVGKLNDGQYQLCFARGVSSSGGSTAMTVVAHCETAGDTIIITWQNKYQMTASKSSFDAGVRDIDFHQAYHLNENWTSEIISGDNCPDASFQFKNDAEASCVINQFINGKSVGIFISPTGTLLPGTDTLTPVNIVKVWWQQNITTGTMISSDQTNAQIIDYTGITEQAVSYDGTKWTLG